MIAAEEHYEEVGCPDAAAEPPEDRLYEGIAGFKEALAALDAGLSEHPTVHEPVFQNSKEWRRLFDHKLVPQMSLDSGLVVAVAGGTNTGKSTLFNLLLREVKSAACSTAAATCAPVLVTGPSRYQDALENRLLPGFSSRSLECPEDATRYEMPEETLWVGVSSLLPDTLALLDTPDVDSIECRNWGVADAIRAAGDVVIAVLTPEKYKDTRVVEFFRQAHASGRCVVPVMNKANRRDNFAMARAQLAEFAHDTTLENPVCFVLPFDYEVDNELDREISALDTDMPLLDYLSSLDVAAIKQRVYRETLACFLSGSECFLESLDTLHDRMRGLSPAFERHAAALTEGYHPQPGVQMSQLLHEQIRAQRPMMMRRIARVNDIVVQKMQPATRFVKRRILGLHGARPVSEAERLALLRENQAGHVKRIANNFLSLLIESARDMEPIAGGLIQSALDQLEQESIVNAIAEDMLGSTEELSEDFREKTAATIRQWWENNPEHRRFLLELDALMVFGPSAMLVFVGALTAGIGAPEFMALASPMAGEYVARIMESKFAEHWVGLLKPWQQEQREKLTISLQQRLIQPALTPISEVLEILDGGCVEQLRRYWKLCQSGSQAS